MLDFITLSCPTCGAKLQITTDMDRFVCAHCGNEHIIRRQGGTITLKPITDAISQVREGVDRTAAELGIVRINEEIKKLTVDLNAVSKRMGERRKYFIYLIASFFLGVILAFSNQNSSFGILWAVGSILLFAYNYLRLNSLSGDANHLQDEIRKRTAKLDKFKSIVE